MGFGMEYNTAIRNVLYYNLDLKVLRWKRNIIY